MLLRGERVLVKVMPIAIWHDYKGGPKFFRFNDLALVGACPLCHWKGVRACSRNLYCGRPLLSE